MIKSIKIKNIQSHKETELNLHKGINCIIGSSNNGKSAILRAFYWVRYNRPLGIDSLCSHWAINEKGNQIDDMEVTVDNGNIITRRRTKSENQYIVNNKELNVVKSDIPSEVEQAFRLSDTNIQKQLDEPFLLSNTNGEVAKYFNSIVRLDVIDKVLTKAETTRRKNKQEIETLEKIIKNQELKLSQYDWLETSEKLITKYENVKSKNDKLLLEQKKLYSSIIDFENLTKNKNKYNFTKSKELIEEIEKLKLSISELKSKIDSLQNTIDDFNSIKIYPSFEKEKKLMTKISNLDNIQELNSKIAILQNSVSEVIACSNVIEWKKKEINDLKDKLPEICPVCGGKL